jgi:hypothetical protein
VLTDQCLEGEHASPQDMDSRPPGAEYRFVGVHADLFAGPASGTKPHVDVNV